MCKAKIKTSLMKDSTGGVFRVGVYVSEIIPSLPLYKAFSDIFSYFYKHRRSCSVLLRLTSNFSSSLNEIQE